MAINCKLYKFLFACFVSIISLSVFSQSGFSAIYEWENYSKIFDQKTGLICRLEPTVIKVNLPEKLKNYESIPLVARVDSDASRRLRRHYLIVNNFDKEKYYIKTNANYRIEINSKHLKAGINTLKFINSIDWCSHGSLVRELRFDFSGMEEVRADIKEKPSP